MTKRNSAWCILVTACLLLTPVFRGSAQYASFSSWTNAAGDLLWSNPLNWSPNGVPTDTGEVDFEGSVTTPLGLGATNVQGAVNCIVDIDASVTNMFFNVTNPYSHTILINPGRTLRMVPNPNVTSGQFDKFTLRPSAGTTATNAIAYVAFRGAGSMIIGDTNNPSTQSEGTRIHINGQNPSASTVGNHMATLDLGGLDFFAFALGNLRVGASASGAAGNRGTLILAKTNILMCGDSSASNPPGGLLVGNGTINSTGNFDSTGEIQLGQENVFQIVNAKIGGGRAALGTLRFQPGLINPTFKWRGLNGSSGASTISIGDSFNAPNNAAYNNSSSTGRVDLVGGTVDILVDNLNIGRNLNVSGSTSTRAISGDGTLTFSAGSIAATTLAVGSQAANNAGNVTGVVNVLSNAMLFADNISVGRDSGNGAGTGNGTINVVNGGSVTVTNNLREDSSTVTGTSRLNLTNGTLTVGGLVRVDNLYAQASVLNLNVTTANTAANPVCDVTNLAFGTPVTINLGGSNLSLARYAVIRYWGPIGGDGFAAVTLGTQPAFSLGYLTNNTTTRTIEFVVTNVPAAKWTGIVNGNWDINTTTNWLNSVSSVPVTYVQNTVPGDSVIFDDSAVGTKTVNLTTTVSPNAVLVGATNDYALVGVGNLSGPGGLSKSGSGTLEIATGANNDYSGSTIVAGGTLRVNASISSSAVTVQAGAMLAGTGTLSAPVTIATGATLSVGNNGIGTLTAHGGLSMASGSTSIFEINTDTLASDQLAGFGVVNFGGSLVLNLTGSGAAITGGAAIPIFAANSYSGSFQTSPRFTPPWVLRGTPAPWRPTVFCAS